MEIQARREFHAMKREEVIRLGVSGRLAWNAAASILRVTPRQLRRIRQRYAQGGKPSLYDARSRARGKRVAVGREWEILMGLKRGVYADYSTQHFYEAMALDYGYRGSYSTLLRRLQAEGVVSKTEQRGTYRRRRPRQPLRGMRSHTDGSTHPWLGEGLPTWDLVIMLDDADSRLLAARFVPQESLRFCCWKKWC